MKKSLFLPSNFLRPFLVALPMAALLCGAIIMNDTVDTPMRLYPLIVVCALGIIFTFVYFFKAVVITKDEVKYVGPFSSRDSAIINEGKTLIITKLAHGKLAISLYGNDGVNASLDWLKSETVRDVYLFKGKVIGGALAIKSVLRFFSVCDEDLSLLISEEVTLERDDYTLSSANTENGREVKIKFKKTL